MENLTNQEIKVASLFAQGLNYKEVSQITFTERTTISKQVQSIYDKTQIKRSLTSLMMWFSKSPYAGLENNCLG
ncbi:MAG: hypothetical protein RSC72_11130 [Algoriella sp.]|uniref:helix-turn-helix transcriptional regulator n=1 Tax=Algoriella sp. TaxID=1872434 RepID=UPI002FC97989